MPSKASTRQATQPSRASSRIPRSTSVRGAAMNTTRSTRRSGGSRPASTATVRSTARRSTSAVSRYCPRRAPAPRMRGARSAADRRRCRSFRKVLSWDGQHLAASTSCAPPPRAVTTADRSRDEGPTDTVTPLEDLVRTLTPPLEYLVGAPHQISPAALPLKTIHEKLARASGGARDAPVQETLTEIAASLDRLATEPSVALVRRVLELLAKLDAAPAASSARPAYIR